MYAIQATYSHRTPDGWNGVRQIPTFYLDENVQGIVDEAHAEKIARDILSAAVRELPVDDALHVTAVKL